LSSQPARSPESKARSEERPRSERISTIRANRSDCTVALNSPSSHSRSIDRSNPDMRQDHEETGYQSVQAAVGIKRNLLLAVRPIVGCASNLAQHQTPTDNRF
jgi:hypothetical protein